MTIPLWVLAVGSVLVGYLGVPHALGGPVGIAHVFNDWLAPVFGGHGPVEGAAHAGPSRLAEELGLMAVSVAVAAGGVGLAYLMYYRKTIRPETFSEAAGGVPYRAVYAKYWVDELYQLVFVEGILALTRILAWFDQYVIDGIVNLTATVTRAWSAVTGLFDDTVVDGAVNGVADGTYAVGQRLRWIQTGAITSYLYVVLIGVLGGVFLYWSWASAH
jgi:NADH-quinone oxidoreductase subunit L